MKVLVTGSQGYIGSVLGGVLSKNGYDYMGYDTGFFCEGLLTAAPANEKIKKLDVRLIEERDIIGFDVVVHLAAISNDPMKKLSAEQVYDPTRLYTNKLAQMCKKHGVRFIFASSCSVYGIGSVNLLSEEASPNPQTPYSINKLQIEEDLMKLADKSFSPIALRFATVFGPSPRIRFDVVVNMLVGMAVSEKKITLNSDGMAWRPNLHIMDACNSILAAIESNYSEGELLVVNVGHDDANLRIIDLVKLIKKCSPSVELNFLNKNPSIDKEGFIKDRKISNDGKDIRTYKVSFKKLETVFKNFSIQYPVERGIYELVDYFHQLGLNRNEFKRREFYRLQQLEYLLENGSISNSLLWVE